MYMYNVSESRLVLYFNIMCKKRRANNKRQRRYVRKRKKDAIRHTHRYLDVYRHSIVRKL